MSFDLIIANVRVVRAGAAPPFETDIGIKDGKFPHRAARAISASPDGVISGEWQRFVVVFPRGERALVRSREK
jgi:N-acyl-D-aspartate/D-glutamate deacylase